MNNHKKTDSRKNSLYLCAPVNALVEGIYEENIPLSKIREHGDFGLGTFNDLDGEMLMLDGTVYQIDGKGQVNVVEDDVMTPFACVTFYSPLSEETIEGVMDYDTLLEWISRLLPSPNIFYAIRIDGHFSHVRTRSVPKQENYRPLVEVAQEQPVFDFYNLEGTLAGFFTPSFMGSVNVPGIHLHFLSKDLKKGGHLLTCSPITLQIGVQFINALELSLPMTLDYLTWDLTRDVGKDLDRAEKEA
ncbi:acetolactate decarboxylase [Thermodesulfobacteriota bacterium]